MADDHATAGNGNGADDAMTGEQLVNHALHILRQLTGVITSDAIDAVIMTAIEHGASLIDCGLIATQLPPRVITAGINRARFEARWKEVQRQYDAMRRAERAADRAEQGAETDDEPVWRRRTPDEDAVLRAALGPRVAPLLESATLLDDVVKVLHTLGVAGAEKHIKAHYLVYTTRLAQRPVSVNSYGAPAGGKSFIADRVLFDLFPAEAYHVMKAGSTKAAVYWPATFLVHRIVYLGEATALLAGAEKSEAHRFLSDFIRQMQSDGRFFYDYAEPPAADDPDRRSRTKSIVIDGPVCIVSTSTRFLQDENDTRTLTLRADESQAHTDAILGALGDAGFLERVEAVETPDLTVWRDLQVYLAACQLRAVIPYVHSLRALTDKTHLRIRRDFSALLTLIEAHTVLNQRNRERTPRGRVVATLDDYGAVHAIFADDFDRSLELRPDEALLDLCRLIERLATEQHAKDAKLSRAKPKDADSLSVAISTRGIATALGVSHGTARRRTRQAIEDGLLEDLRSNQRPGSTEIHRLRLRKGALAETKGHNRKSSIPTPDGLAEQWEKDQHPMQTARG
jgi:hypothetical protein